MLDPALPPLSEWETFYVITGGAAAALTGLMFVVIALRTETVAESGEAVRAFGSPNVLHFCGVLLIAALLTIPRHSATPLALCVAATGIAGLALSAWVAFAARRQSAYRPVLSDWTWHVALPLVAYGTLALGGAVMLRRPPPALDLVAAASLLLLFIGIHNAWDSAVWIAAKR
jgi:hypothetical protein